MEIIINKTMEKHLEFIQSIISRHNSNSFMLKGWSVTISAALYALAGTIKEPFIVLIALAPIILFWGLDAFYLSNERCFVDLYNAVAEGAFSIPKIKMFKKDFKKDVDKESGTISSFDMNFKKFEIWKDNSWIIVLQSKTIIWFYLPLATITFLVMLFFSLVKPDFKVINVNANLKADSLELKVNTTPPTIVNNLYPSCNKKDTTKEILKNTKPK